MQGMTIIVKKITQIMAPVIFLFGLYVIVHGHLSPGGGFAGGVILAAAFILQILSFGSILPSLRREEVWLELLESTAVMGFLVISGLGLLLASFRIFFLNFINRGTVGQLLSGGIIPLENIVVGAEVCAAITTIFIALTVYQDEVTQ